MHKKHVVNYLVLQKKETTVRRRLLLQVATLVKERASQLCLEWQITVVVVVASYSSAPPPILRGFGFPDWDLSFLRGDLLGKTWSIFWYGLL